MRRACSPVAGAALAWLIAGCARSHERERVDFERMRLQQRADVYASSGAFPSGAVALAPPDSTIPIEAAGDLSLTSARGDTGAAIPITATPELIGLGHERFTTYCAVCHGVAGFGGSLVALNMGPPRPPSLRRPAALAFPPAYIYSVATHGLGRMPAYSPQLSARERWAVAAYVKYLQRSTVVDGAAREDSARAAEITRIDSLSALEARR
jgi:mono/diheme cytochrome c family protein